MSLANMMNVYDNDGDGGVDSFSLDYHPLHHHEEEETEEDEDETQLFAELEDALIREQQREEQEGGGISSLQPQQPPNPLAISDEERHCALRLKAKVEEIMTTAGRNEDDDDDDICIGTNRPLNDFQYAHHAIVERDDNHLVDDYWLERTAHKILGLQEFRATYGINDTVEQGVDCLDKFMTQQKGFVLHLDLSDDDNENHNHEAIRVLDVAKLNPRAAMQIPDSIHWKTFVCGLYYMHTACSPTLASIRQGIFEIADLDSFSAAQNFHMEFEYRRHGELLKNYPLKFKTIMAFNTGYWATLSWNLMKPMMNENARNSIQLGCQVVDDDGGGSGTRRLAEFYLQPSVEVAQQSILERAKTMLQLRYHNEQILKL